MKLDAKEKSDRKYMLAMLREANGAITYCKIRGATVAVVPVVESCRGTPRFYKLAAAYCADDDEFKRKRGEYLAMNRLFWWDEFIRVPGYGLTAQQIADRFIAQMC